MILDTNPHLDLPALRAQVAAILATPPGPRPPAPALWIADSPTPQPHTQLALTQRLLRLAIRYHCAEPLTALWLRIGGLAVRRSPPLPTNGPCAPGGSLRAVHQFSFSLGLGDGTTGGVFYIRRLLRTLGLESRIYTASVPPAIKDQVSALSSYRCAPAQLLLCHHGGGHPFDRWLAAVSDPKVLVYHNLTPDHLFSPGDPNRLLVRHGRHQLARWATTRTFVGALADSDYNRRDLDALAYPHTATLPLLVDPACLPDTFRPPGAPDAPFTLLFVGRLLPHKNTLALIEILDHLLGWIARPTRLLLVGAAPDPTYLARLHAEIARRDLQPWVTITGPVSPEDLAACYRTADVYVSASQHEGFGMPLIEASTYGIPVVARENPGVTETLGCGGVIIRDFDPLIVAALLTALSRAPHWVRQIRAGQAKNLQRFAIERVQAGLVAYLVELGYASPTGENGSWAIPGLPIKNNTR